jgi:hypothetical protein
MDRETLRAYFKANPREWAKVAPIPDYAARLITALADRRYISDARLLNFASRKDAVDRVDEADCMKIIMQLFRSDEEYARLKAIAAEAEQRMAEMGDGAQGPEVASRANPTP